MAAETNEPAVRVTLGTIYKELLELKRLVEPLPNQVSDHETRIRALESWKERAAGVRTVLNGLLLIGGGALVSFVLTHVIK